mgnify:CR=1 FL=1
MLKNKFLKFGAWIAALPVLFVPLSVLAVVTGGGLAGSTEKLGLVGTSAGQSDSNLPKLIGNMISAILGVLGIIFVILIIQSGIQYMTSGGAEEKVKEAKKRIVTAVVGIVIILAAYAISSFVITQLTNVAAGT